MTKNELSIGRIFVRREFITIGFRFGWCKVEWVAQSKNPRKLGFWKAEDQNAYLKTSPNLSDTRMVCESFVNANSVGLFGSSLT